MARQALAPREEVRLWRAAWDELEGYLLRGLGHYKMAKAKAARNHIRRPMPNDIPYMIAAGSKMKACANTLGFMKELKGRIYHGRNLTPWQSAKLETAFNEVEEEIKDE